jgi:hypothetical protein
MYVIEATPSISIPESIEERILAVQLRLADIRIAIAEAPNDNQVLRPLNQEAALLESKIASLNKQLPRTNA